VDQKALISNLIKNGYLSSPIVIKAMETTSREIFLPSEKKPYAHDDTPLEIGEGQTISAPHMVAIMAEALDLKKGQKVLEIGTGSGYHAAIIAHIINPGHLYTIERHQKLADKAKKNLIKAGITNVTVITGDGSIGLSQYAPYQRIYVTCASPRVPPPLLTQLDENGRLLIPTGRRYSRLLLIKKNHDISTKDLGACVFVPLIGKEGFGNEKP
jgi:protein-L-isoaspartate(D-aspartate) O-methyltransferase